MGELGRWVGGGGGEGATRLADWVDGCHGPSRGLGLTRRDPGSAANAEGHGNTLSDLHARWGSSYPWTAPGIAGAVAVMAGGLSRTCTRERWWVVARRSGCGL